MIYSFYFIIQFYYYLLSPQKFITMLCSPIQADLPVYSHLSPNLTLLFLYPLELRVLLAEGQLPDAPAVCGRPCRAGRCRCRCRRPLHVCEGFQEITLPCRGAALAGVPGAAASRWR